MATTPPIQIPLKVLKPLLLVSMTLVVIGALLFFTQNFDLALIGVTLALAPAILWGGSLLFFLPVALHEGAHWWVGRLCGYEFGFIRIGRLQWMNRQGKIRFREIDARWLSGMTQMVPAAGKFSRSKFAIYVAAGPLVNLITATLTLPFVLPHGNPLLRLAGTILAYVSVALGVASLIPMTRGGRSTDGMTLMRLAKGDPFVPRSLALRRLMRATEELVPPEQWSGDDLEVLASASADDPDYPAGLLYTYYRAMLLGQNETAGDYIRQAVAATPPTSNWFRPVHLNAAIFFGFVNRDGARAQDSLNAFDSKPIQQSYTYPMAVAATHLGQGRYGEALKAADVAISILNAKDATESVYPQELMILKSIREDAMANIPPLCPAEAS